MSLLQQDSQQDLDDAARSAEFAKGGGNMIWAALAAAVAVSAAIAVYVIAGQKPPAATGEIVQVWAHPVHTETSGIDANGAPMPKESFDQVLVFARVRLHNQSTQPLFLHEIMSNAMLDDGIHSSYAAIAPDYERMFVAYPALAALHGTALPYDATIEPGQTLQGDFVSAFRVTRQQWQARKNLNFSFAFRYQPNLVVAAQAVTEQ